MHDIPSQIETILRELIDPEAGINVIDLGLLHDVNVEADMITVEMIPTTPGCPLLHAMGEGATAMIEPHFPDHRIDVVWRLDVEWTPERMRVNF